MQTLEVALEKFSYKKLDIINVGSGLLSSLKRVRPTAQDHGVRINSPEFYEPETVQEDDKIGYRYISKILLKKKGRDFGDVRNNLETVEYELIKKAEAKGWRLCSTTPVTDRVNSIVNVPKVRPKLVLPELTPKLIDKYFKNILFDRDSHVRLIHDAVSIAVETDFQKRPHVLLHGPPAGGKTSLFLKMKELYETEDMLARGDGELIERFVLVDAPQMTRAGIVNELINRYQQGNTFEFLIIEEIEKCNNAADILSFLLGIMDDRGILSKKTARINVQIEQRLSVFATSNNIEELKSIHSEALWSRFQCRYFCERPGIDLIRLILMREINKIPGGNPKWVDRAIDIGVNVLGTEDIRVFIGLLSGRNRLLDGSFKDDLIRATEKNN